MSYRVVYGETLPAWEQTFRALEPAMVFALGQARCGDVIFSIAKVVPGEPPRSIMAAIEADEDPRPLMPIFKQPNPARTRARSKRRTKR